LATKIVAGTANKGTATFQGSATLNNAIGDSNLKLAKVEFTGAGSNVVLNNKDIHATVINFAAQNVTVGTDVTLDGGATLTGSNVILGGNQLTAGGNLNLAGAITLTSSIAQDSAGNLTGGAVVVPQGSTLSYVAGSTITLSVDKSKISHKSGTHNFTLLDNSKGTVGTAPSGIPTFVNDPNSFSQFSATFDANGSIILAQSSDVMGAITSRFKTAGAVMTGADKTNIVLLQEATGDGEKLVNAMNDMDAPKTVETLQRLIANEINQELQSVLSDAATNVAGRMFVNNPGSFGGQPIETASGNTPYSGVAAGEEAGRYGVWANPFFGNGTQKARKGTAGYKSERYGASIGFDVKANDNMMVGAAVTYLNTNIKHKNQKVGDTTKADSVLFSIYGMQQFTDNWFGQGIATFGSNKVKNNEGRRISQDTMQLAIGNYSSMSFGGEVMAGYNYFTDQFTLTPMAGIRYTRVNDGGYRESGTDFENLDVNKKASNKFEVVVGARATASAFDLNGMSVTPEVHGFINHDMIGKNPDVQMRLNGVNGSLASNKAKPTRTNYTLGAGLNAGYGMMEYGIGYDANIANKYLGHQGSVKVRVNF
jgi:outer membrane autotransporter protein